MIVAAVSVVVVAPTFVDVDGLVFLGEAGGHQESQQGYLYGFTASVNVMWVDKFVYACYVSG